MNHLDRAWCALGSVERGEKMKHSQISTEIVGERFLREAEVKRVTGLSRTTRWRLERRGQFPKRRRLSQNAIGWLESEIHSWMAARAEAAA